MQRGHYVLKQRFDVSVAFFPVFSTKPLFSVNCIASVHGTMMGY